MGCIRSAWMPTDLFSHRSRNNEFLIGFAALSVWSTGNSWAPVMMGDAFAFVALARDDNSVESWTATDYESRRGGGAEAMAGVFGVVATGIRPPNTRLDHRRQAPISCEGSPSQSGAGRNDADPCRTALLREVPGGGRRRDRRERHAQFGAGAADPVGMKLSLQPEDRHFVVAACSRRPARFARSPRRQGVRLYSA